MNAAPRTLGDPPTPTCFARGCDAPRGADKLMCRAHWDRVPLARQLEVYRAYRARRTGARGTAAAYVAAIRAAREAVTPKEARPS